MNLSENFQKEGTKIESFFDAIAEMDSITNVKTVYTSLIGISSVISREEDAKDVSLSAGFYNKKTYKEYTKLFKDRIDIARDEGSLLFAHAEPNTHFLLKRFSLAEFESIGWDKAIINEIVNKTALFLSIEGENYGVSSIAIPTLLNRANIAGDKMFEPSFRRASVLAWALRKEPKNITVITREHNGAKMIFAAHSDKYCYMKQSTLKDIYEKLATTKLGTVKGVKWSVSHQLSCCYVEFPDAGKDFADAYGLPDEVVPGLFLSTSDTGFSSLTISGFWRVGNHIVGNECLKRSHRGTVDLNQIVEDVEKEIFSTYTKVPEKLCELLTIEVSNPVATLKRVFTEVGIANAVGRKNKDKIQGELCAEFVSGKYTAYDIATKVFSIADRLGVKNPNQLEKLRAAGKRAIFLDYKEKPSSSVELAI